MGIYTLKHTAQATCVSTSLASLLKLPANISAPEHDYTLPHIHMCYPGELLLHSAITLAAGAKQLVCCHAGLGGSYFSPPWISLLAFKYDNAGRREPSNALARDEQAWSKLYTRTLEIVNSKLDVQGLPPIEPA